MSEKKTDVEREGEARRTAILLGDEVMVVYRQSVAEMPEPVVLAFDLADARAREAAREITSDQDVEARWREGRRRGTGTTVWIRVQESDAAARTALAARLKPSWRPHLIASRPGHVPVLVFAGGGVAFGLRCAHPGPPCPPARATDEMRAAYRDARAAWGADAIVALFDPRDESARELWRRAGPYGAAENEARLTGSGEGLIHVFPGDAGGWMAELLPADRRARFLRCPPGRLRAVLFHGGGVEIAELAVEEERTH